MANLKLAGLALSMLVLGCVLGYAVIQFNNSLINAESRSWNEPPKLSKTIETLPDIFDDLKSLGCTIVNCSSFFGDPKVGLTDYVDFRRFAFNGEKIVFYDKNVGVHDSYLCTIYEGVFIQFP